MLRRGQAPRLVSLVASRMVVAAIVVSAVLAGIFFVQYSLDTLYLRSTAMENLSAQVAGQFAEGKDPARLAVFRNHSGAYGFRMWSGRLASQRQLLASANEGLLPAVPRTNDGQPANFEQTFQALPAPPGGQRSWYLVEREEPGKNHYWVETVMRSDPARLWLGVIGEEMWDHALLPLLSFAPALVLAMLLAVRHALKPVLRLADQAERTRRAAAEGRPLEPLAVRNLPAEFTPVVAAINAMLGRLEQTLERQRQFTADVAHELRTPLAVLSLQVAELPVGAAREKVRAELGALSRLVNELMSFAQAEEAFAAGRTEVELAALTRKVCEELALVAVRRGQVIELESAAPPITVRGSAVLIEIAIRNVVENALKYSPAAATVTVRLDATGRLLVEDRGPGMKEVEKKQAFERFWRRRGEGAGGSGVGLALVRRVAELHAGDVRIEDRPGGGARLVLALSQQAAEGR